MLNRSADYTMSSDQQDKKYTLRNAKGMAVTITERGASLVSWLTPDRYGRLADVLLGYHDVQDYVENTSFFGAIIGRWANRIADGKFILNGTQFAVERNNNNHHLHGGATGFHRARWDVIEKNGELWCHLDSPDGEGGFPGNLSLDVRYSLDDTGQLMIQYEAQTDSATPINLTSHPYFNLNGGSVDISDHILTIDSSHYLKTNAEQIPVEIVPVAGSAFDFRHPAPIGSRMNWPDEQIQLNQGFDHCYCLQPELDGRPGKLREVATVYDPCSGRNLSVSTDQAGLQFYTGNFLGGVKGRASQTYDNHAGFCLEAQAYPDQINSTFAEAAVLRPGQIYRQTTAYRIWL